MGFELDDIQPGSNEKVMVEVELSELYHHQAAALYVRNRDLNSQTVYGSISIFGVSEKPFVSRSCMYVEPQV